jgi:hypothetical protein
VGKFPIVVAHWKSAGTSPGYRTASICCLNQSRPGDVSADYLKTPVISIISRRFGKHILAHEQSTYPASEVIISTS